jgi:glycyl-tRNA synthetase beta chain
MKYDLLLEIGTEEIPASFLAPASEALKEIITKFFSENRIDFGRVKSFYTPRRITLIVDKVAEKQKEEILELQGPPKKHAFDEKGHPTKVAIGFANSNRVKVKDLYTKQTPKGEYVCVKKKAAKKRIDVLLKENLSQIISKIQFPKTMRWDEGKTRFARPIRWISLVYGNKPVSAQVAGLTTSAYTIGHRNSKVKKLKITDVKKYEKMLKGVDVIINPEQRKKVIKKQLDILSIKVKGKVVEDDELLKEATNICEMPNPILCKFKPEFLNLPSIVLITGLKTHTRSFAVKPQISTTSSDRLLPYFIAISNTPTCDKKEVAYWYEEAVEARLEDAKFYFDEDVKIGFEKRVEEEKKVVWIENLGSLFDKTSRLEKLSFVIAQRISGVNSSFLLRAAYLSKADLLTNMVREKEYTSLQGVMGGIYAQVSGEDELVSKIISEHYLPKSGDDNLPKTKEGAILSMADKIDNIVGAFVISAIPSGSLDPFGLRRQANAVHTICLNKIFFLNLEPIIENSCGYFGKSEDISLVKKISGFFKERLNALLLDKGIKYDVANAVLAAEGINSLDAYNRAIALSEFRKQEQFESLVIGQKRVNNILKCIQDSFIVQTDLLKEPAELQLYSKTHSIENQLNDYVRVYNYKDALDLLLSLRPEIDSFFDKVLVMTEDLTLRNNRLGLLQYIKSLFRKVADLSEIVIQ